MDVSVLICTRNRAGSLRRVLESACLLTIPPGLRWEIVIVDNGSEDSTAKVVAGFSDRLPIRRAVESVAGLSNARNRGIAEARGTLLCWTDDDVLIDAGWLKAYVDASRRFADASFFGGRVVPVLESPTPSWFARVRQNEHIASLLAQRDLGDEPVLLANEGDRLPYGANFAILSSAQSRFRFDPELGVAPGRNRSGEETKVFRALLGGGHHGRWVPEAQVRHIIPASRQTLRYFWKHYAAHGETWVVLDEDAARDFPKRHWENGSRIVAGAPYWIWRRTFASSLRALSARLARDENRWIENIRLMAFHWGAAMAFRGRRSR